MKNNLFNWATNELSQDAFLCWLLSFATKTHSKEDRSLSDCAKDLLKLIIPSCKKIEVTSISTNNKTKYILVVVSDMYYIIIKHNDFTSHHEEEIIKLKESMVKIGIENITSVSITTMEQPHKCEVADINIKRDDLLRIFKNYNKKTTNSIFLDYYNYLLSINKDVNAYKKTSISKWKKTYEHAYEGFFNHLVENNYICVSRGYGWRYVNNSNGGFWGLWWYYLSESELNKANLSKEFMDGLYLEIEDDIITVKLSTKQVGLEINTSARWQLYNYFKEKIKETSNDKFNKKNFRQGRYMTIGYMEYNEKNYKEKIKLIESIMESISKGEFKFNVSNIDKDLINE